MNEVKIKIMVEKDCDDIELPSYQSELAAGMDIRAAVKGVDGLLPGQIRLIPTGIRVAIPAGYEIQVRPRSGLAMKHGITVMNSPGTIDADYRGPVGVILGNFGGETFLINRGDRIAQIVVCKVEHAKMIKVTQLDETKRDSGGFGSTGIN